MTTSTPDFNPVPKSTRTFYYGFLAGGAIVMLLMLFFFRSEVSDMTITGDGGGGFSIDLKKKEMSSQELLDTLWAHEFSKNGLIGFMKKKDYINKNDPEFKDAMMANLETIDTEDPIVTLLKEMAIEGRGPWRIEADSAYFSAPNYKIVEGQAITYRESRLVGKTIIIQSPDAMNKKEVLVKDGLVKATNLPDNLIHLSKADFKEIFGEGKLESPGWVEPAE